MVAKRWLMMSERAINRPYQIFRTQFNRIFSVLEFTADENVVHMPEWMMENMHLKEGDTVYVKNVRLPQGTHLKLQPHSKDFLNITNPKAMLEIALRNFSCVTVGDRIVLPYNNRNYVIDVIEAKPSNAVSIIETDCEVDFAAPLDYVEPTAKPVPIPPVVKEISPEETESGWFRGAARRLDGKPCSILESPNFYPRELKPPEPELKSKEASCKRPGKLVFGSDVGQTRNLTPNVTPAAKDANPEPVKKEEKKFQAFTGRSYSLRD